MDISFIDIGHRTIKGESKNPTQRHGVFKNGEQTAKEQLAEAHRPALPADNPPVPVALRSFTARFGMERRGSSALNTHLNPPLFCCLIVL